MQWDARLVRVFSADTLVTVHRTVMSGLFAPQHSDAEASTRRQGFVDRLLGQCERVGPVLRHWADAAFAARGVCAIRLIQGMLQLTRRIPRERQLAVTPVLIADDPAIRPMIHYTLEDFVR